MLITVCFSVAVRTVSSTASRTCQRAGRFARLLCINGGISLIPKKYAAVVFSFLMALIMSGIMSMVISLFNIGLVEGILTIWLKAWLPAFLVAFPTITVVVPLVRYMVSKLVAAE